MKKPIIKFFDKIILLILGFSGMFYSCYEYGMPVAEYELNGTVTDLNKNPIKNIRIIGQTHLGSDTLFTDSKGKYAFTYNHELFVFNPESPVHLKVEDIDGYENGGFFLPEERDVNFIDADLVKKGRGTKRGDKYAKTENIMMTKSEIIPMYGVPIAPFKP
jgi:putative lipoprotein (rSAM/lipoprotein system)